MFLSDIQLHEAASPAEAAELLARLAPDVRVLAGGTNLLVDLKTGRTETRHLVSIAGIRALRRIRQDQVGLRIGSLTTLSELDSSSLLVGPYKAIKDATSKMAAPQIRNMATVGGNLAGAVPCADLPPILSVMGALVVLRSAGGERRVELEKFFLGPRQTILRQDEILTEIQVGRPPERFGAAYSRLGLRAGNAIAVAGVAVGLVLDGGGRVMDAKLNLSAVAPIPKPVPEAARLLVGRVPDDDAAALAAAEAMDAAEPISDLRGSAEYRRGVVGVLTRRAVALAAQRAHDRGEEVGS